MDSKNDIIVYGAGSLGKATIKFLNNAYRHVKYIVDRNENLRHTFSDDIEIICPEDLLETDKRECDILVCISAVPYFQVEDYLKDIGCRKVYIGGDYIQSLYSQNLFANIWSLDSANYELLKKNDLDNWKDSDSKLQYKIALEWFYSRDERAVLPQDWNLNREKYFPDFIRALLRNDDIMVDTSILNGEYIDKFLNLTSGFGKVYGFCLNPNVISYDHLLEKYRIYENVNIFDIEIGEYGNYQSYMKLGLMEPYTEFVDYKCTVRNIDDLFNDKMFSFLRMYSMNPILPIIRGGKECILRYRPLIAANIGHYREDFIKVPQLLASMLKDYRFYFRIHSYQGNDCIMYAIPNERIES